MHLVYLYFYDKLEIMKRIISTGAIVLAVLFTTVSTGFAQSDPAARQAQMKQKLMTDLKMSEVQADSVVSINASYRPQMRDIFQNQSLSQDDKKAQMKAITDQADKRIQPVLGDSLYNQYKEWRKENMMQMRGGKPGNN
jgi:hypothetical protein